MLQLSHHQIINHRQTSWISALVSCVPTSDTLCVSSNELLNIIYSTWWKNSQILCTTKCENWKTSEKSCADTLHSAVVVTVLVPQIYVILMQARNADLSNNKFICRGTLAYEFALRKTLPYSLLCTVLYCPTQSTLKLLYLWTLLSTVPLFIILPTSSVLSSSRFRQNIELHAGCISLHRAAQTRLPVFFPHRVCNTHHKKNLISAAQALCVTHSLR